MKALRTLTILFALALMCLPAPSAAAAEKPFKLDICAMPEHESFIFWYAKEQGWDKDEGLDFQIHFFQTGMDQLEALPAKQWVVGGTGTVPILVGALRYNTYLIGIANDESWVNAVTVRPDNPALKVKGWNPEYPNLLGSPETVKGKTFLYTQSSSQHFGMSEYLKALGLTEKDVVMQNMDPAQVLAAFDAGIGDFAGIWPMWLYIGMERGNKLIYQPGDVNAVLTLTLVGDKAFCDAHPDIVVKFLRVWLRGVNMIISCGDLPARYLEHVVTMANLPLLYVPGNHDTAYRAHAPEGCDSIDGRIREVAGVRIMGFGGSMRYNERVYGRCAGA